MRGYRKLKEVEKQFKFIRLSRVILVVIVVSGILQLYFLKRGEK